MILDRLDCSFPMENVFASDFIKVTTYLLRSCWIYCDESVQESLQKGLLAGFGHLERRYYPNIARLGLIFTFVTRKRPAVFVCGCF